jgi:excisionase family DNA binding protein
MAESARLAEARGRPDGGRWVTLGKACEVLGVDESTLRRWADSGRVRVYRTPGGHRRFLLGNLEELVARDGSDGEEVGRLAIAKIRRQLQRARQEPGGWYASLSETDRQQLREQGRRLIGMAGAYFSKKAPRAGLLAEARAVGLSYGQILARAGLPLPNAVEAYIGFRKTMDETSRQASSREGMSTEEALAAFGQVHTLGDQVLLGIAAAYEPAEEPAHFDLN